MFQSNQIWHKRPGASTESLQELQAIVGVELPVQYINLLSYSNGGEGPLSVQPYNFCLDSAEYVIERTASALTEEYFPGFLMFGGNGGGEYIGFDLRGGQPWPIVSIDMTNIDLSESVMLIARDFESFLSLVGTEAEDALPCSPLDGLHAARSGRQ
ncbi:SMI1/KNR4 family protein [Massilia sp. SR12]